MKIKKIVIEGFGSIVTPMKYKFDRPGLNLILGENGVGKTQIFNALSWCLYGKLLKGKDSGVSPWPNVITKQNYEGTYVAVELDGFRIVRVNEYTKKVGGIKGKNGLFIFQEGVLLPKRDKRDNQVYINKLIGYSFDLFRNSILFGQKLKRLLEEDGPKKKEIFDEAFESTFILRAREKVDERIKDLKFTYNGQKAEFERYDSLISNNSELLSNSIKEKKRWYKNNRKELATIRQTIKTIKKAIEKFPPDLFNHLELSQMAFAQANARVDKDLVGRELKLDFAKGQLEQDALNKQKEINKVDRISDYCPECGQILKGEAKDKQRQYKKSKLKKLKGEYQVIIDSLSSARKEHKELLSKIEGQKDNVSKLKVYKDGLAKAEKDCAEHMKLETQLELHTKQLANKEEAKCPIKIKVIIAKIAEHTHSRMLINRKMEALQRKIGIDEWLLKEPLSNSGLKAFIFDSMLNKVNFYLKTYTKYIGFGVKVYMDLESANKDFKISILQGAQEVPYDDLSGGQKQLADVALMFSLNDTVTASKPINILLMDEVFESLSQNNIEVVGQIIERKSRDRSIHLITHQNFNPINCYKSYIKLIDPGHTVLDQKYKSA